MPILFPRMRFASIARKLGTDDMRVVVPTLYTSCITDIHKHMNTYHQTHTEVHIAHYTMHLLSQQVRQHGTKRGGGLDKGAVDNLLAELQGVSTSNKPSDLGVSGLRKLRASRKDRKAAEATVESDKSSASDKGSKAASCSTVTKDSTTSSSRLSEEILTTKSASTSTVGDRLQRVLTETNTLEKEVASLTQRKHRLIEQLSEETMMEMDTANTPERCDGATDENNGDTTPAVSFGFKKEAVAFPGAHIPMSSQEMTQEGGPLEFKGVPVDLYNANKDGASHSSSGSIKPHHTSWRQRQSGTVAFTTVIGVVVGSGPVLMEDPNQPDRKESDNFNFREYAELLIRYEIPLFSTERGKPHPTAIVSIRCYGSTLSQYCMQWVKVGQVVNVVGWLMPIVGNDTNDVAVTGDSLYSPLFAVVCLPLGGNITIVDTTTPVSGGGN